MLCSEEFAARSNGNTDVMDERKLECQNEKHLKNILNTSIATLQKKLCQLQRELHFLEEESCLQEQALFNVVFEDEGFSSAGHSLTDITEEVTSDKY